MDRLTVLMDYSVAGNQLWQIVSLFVVILVSLLVGRIIRQGLLKRSEKMEGSRPVLASAMLAGARGVVFLLFIAGAKYGLNVLTYSEKFGEMASTVLGVLITCAVGFVIYSLVAAIQQFLMGLAEKTVSKMDDMLVPMVTKSLRVTIVILTLIQIAQTLSNKPITSILAGLGVGGLAVALAAKDSLQHLFGSLVILADKPFELGERIVFDGYDGTVEKVGFRSTKLRLLNGHLVCVPNGDLASKSIENISRRPFIKRVFSLGVTYDTPPEKLDLAVDILHEILDNHENMDSEKPPVILFTDFNDFSLGIQVIYWYAKNDWTAYCAFSHSVNREILSRFNAENIEFAFPTQTIHLAGKDA